MLSDNSWITRKRQIHRFCLSTAPLSPSTFLIELRYNFSSLGFDCPHSTMFRLMFGYFLDNKKEVVSRCYFASGLYSGLKN